MSNPFGIGDLSAMGLPGANPLQGAGIAETMDLVRKAWASFSLPPSMAPTIDPDEIGRRIAELKTVEQWLSMNLTMLRSTIQALEIQQATLNALRAFGVNPAAAQGGSRSEPSIDPGTGTDSGMGGDSGTRADPDTRDDPATRTDSGERGTAAAAHPLADALNPVAWWDMLQKQFSEVTAAALAGVPAVIDAATGATRPAASIDGTGDRPQSRGRRSTRPGSESPAGKAASGKTAARGAAARRPAPENNPPGDAAAKTGVRDKSSSQD